MISARLTRCLPRFYHPMVFLILFGLATLGAAGSRTFGNDPLQPNQPNQLNPTSVAPTVNLQLSDGSKLKVAILDERIELDTPHGKLSIAVAEIHQIDFGLHIPEDMQKQIDAAIADLGHPQFQRREAATAVLLKLGEKAYPALLEVEKGKDSEIGQRVNRILEDLRKKIPEESLVLPPDDIIQTKDSKITGRIKLDTLKVNTLAFGEQQIKLTYLRKLTSPAATPAKEEEIVKALPDPGTMNAFQGQVGQTIPFKVTGPPPALATQMGVWGTDVYTVDSSLAASAVHAGAIKPGETGVVWVTLVGIHNGFIPSVQNGVMSRPWNQWTGFRVEKNKPNTAEKK